MIKIKENVILSRFSNYKIGGPARYFFEAKTVKAVKEAVYWGRTKKQNFFILGGGTNLLFSDKGFNGFILKPDIKFLKISGMKVKAGAGVLMSDLLKFATKHGLSGLEWAGGLPGTLGGAIRGNAGAFKGEIKDSIESVTSFNIKNSKVFVRKNKACRFSYRTSLFKEKDNEEIILEATLKLKKGNPKEIRAAILDKIDFRKKKHPLEYPNSGSVFKNVPLTQIFKKETLEYTEAVHQSNFNLKGSVVPVKSDPFPVIPTAYLISESELKGITRGGAMISTKHPNFIVNVKNAKARDVLALIKLVKSTLKRKFGISAEEEVQIVN